MSNAETDRLRPIPTSGPRGREPGGKPRRTAGILTGEGVAVFGLLAFTVLIRIPSLTQPLGPDQGIMAVIGQGILEGGLPYRDYWEMGSPAVFLTYALMFKLFGIHAVAIPITDILVSSLTTFLIYLLGRRLWGRGAGYASALFFAFFSNGVRLGMHAGGDIAFGTFWYIAQRETFMLPLITGSLYLLIRAGEGEGTRRLLLSGFLAGLAFVYKFPALVILFCALLYWNVADRISGRKRPRGAGAIGNAALLSGFALALVPFALWFAGRGAFREMVDVVFGFVFSVYGNLHHDTLALLRAGLTRTLFIAEENFLLWIFFAASSLHILLRDRRAENLLPVLWGLASLAFVASHREFFGYHYLMVLPPFSLLAGYGFLGILGPSFRLRRRMILEAGQTFVLLALVINLIFFASLNYMHYTKFFYFVTGAIDRETYEDFFTAYPGHHYSYPADRDAARYIARRTRKSDPIFVLGGTESVVYFLAQRRSPSRFIFSWILFSETHGKGPRAQAYRRELLADLEHTPPRYILCLGPLERYRAYGDIYAFLHGTYVLEKRFRDDRFLYARKI